jgi:hypothetical protein
MAMVLKTIVAATSPWVRIPRPPLITSENSPELDLYPPIPCCRFVTDRSQMQPTAAICRWSRDIRGMDREAFPQVNLRETEGSRQKQDPAWQIGQGASASSILLLAAFSPPSMHFAYTRSSTSTL